MAGVLGGIIGRDRLKLQLAGIGRLNGQGKLNRVIAVGC
jgi:hypothetical protein